MCICRGERRQNEKKKEEAILESWNSWVASVKGACEGAWEGIFKRTERETGVSGSMGALREKILNVYLVLQRGKEWKYLK